MIKISLTRLYVNGCSEALNSLIEVSPSVKRNTFIIVSVSVLGVDLNSRCIVLNSQAKLTQLIISETTIEKCLEMVRINL